MNRDPKFLYLQLRWFTRLRWLAGTTVVAVALVDQTSIHAYEHSRWMLDVGVGVIAYNAILWLLLVGGRRSHGAGAPHSHPPNPLWSGRRNFLLMLAWSQLLLDLGSLTLLVLWTGGVHSPITGFFVFQMVFASLLLPRPMAYASAATAIALYGTGLALMHREPFVLHDQLLLSGQIVVIVVTVFLANHIMRGLRQQRRRLLRQNRRIRTMSRQIKRHQQAMTQQEKMVALGQMAAGVTHEIANPLASMDSLLQLMQRKPDRIRPDAVNVLREQIARINQIIHQMKSFAHPMETQRETVELNHVVDEAVKMVQFDQRMKHVAVKREFDASIGSIPLLPQALQQVLVNLIVNALDAMADAPEPRLYVSTQRRDGAVLIEIADNGTGIPAENMSRLFEPFFTTKAVGKGTGLGLSISYSLIQKQRGSISVKSQPGKGASFTIRLPTTEASRNREAPDQGAIASENPEAS